MKIATAAYSLDVLDSWLDYAAKIRSWVSEAAGEGADVLVFPEYGSMEIATLDGPDVAGDLERCIDAVSDRISDVDGLHSELAMRYGVHILAASAPVRDPAFGDRPVNRARFFSPGGEMGVQDKQIMTRFERDTWQIAPGGPLRLFETELGRFGVLICYDSEFPLIGRALSEADVLLVPSCTETLRGYSRVRIGAMARALEQQCVSAMSSIVGANEWSPVVDLNTGRGGVFGPPDTGFAETGVVAEGTLNAPGWTYAEIDPKAIRHVRADGMVLNHLHWDEQSGRSDKAELIGL